MPMNMRALSAGGELPGGLKQKQVMKAINIAHIARSFILEIYMYFKHSELEGITKKKIMVVSCDRSLVKSFGQVLWLGPGHTGLVKSFGQVIWLPLEIYFL